MRTFVAGSSTSVVPARLVPCGNEAPVWAAVRFVEDGVRLGVPLGKALLDRGMRWTLRRMSLSSSSLLWLNGSMASRTKECDGRGRVSETSQAHAQELILTRSRKKSGVLREARGDFRIGKCVVCERQTRLRDVGDVRSKVSNTD